VTAVPTAPRSRMSRVTVPQLLATVCQALGIDHQKQNISNTSRPIRLVEPGTQAIKDAVS